MHLTRPRWCVLAALVLLQAACGGSSQAAPAPVGGPPRLLLGAASTRFLVGVTAGEHTGRAIATLAVRSAERGELLAVLTIESVDDSGEDAEKSPLAGLAGVSFRWRMDRSGVIVAAGGPAAPSRVPAEVLARALELWPLMAAAVPRLPDGQVAENASWDAYQRTQVIGGGHERIVVISGQWRLAKLLAMAPTTAVLEASLTIGVRDALLPPEDQEAKARSITARAVVYVNLERRAVDFATVTSEAFSWQARRL